MNENTNIAGNEAVSAQGTKTISYPLVMIISALLALTSSLLPLILSGKEIETLIISIAVCILSALIMFVSSAKVSSAVWKTVLLALTAFYVGSPIFPAITFGAVISIGAGSAAICSAKRFKLAIPLLSAPVAFGISFIITNNLIVSLFSLLLFFPTLVLGISSRVGCARTTSLTLSAISISLLAIGGTALAIFSAYGSISYESIAAASESFKARFVSELTAAMVEIAQIEMNTVLQKELVLIVDTYVNVSIGILGAAAIITSYLANSIQLGIYKKLEMSSHLSPGATMITVSLNAAIIFIIAHLLSQTTSSSGGTSLVAVVGTNICLILFPALLHTSVDGVRYFLMRFGFIGIIVLIALIIAIFSMFSQILTLLSLFGAFVIIIKSVDAWAKEHYGKGENK